MGSFQIVIVMMVVIVLGVLCAILGFQGLHRRNVDGLRAFSGRGFWCTGSWFRRRCGIEDSRCGRDWGWRILDKSCFRAEDRSSFGCLDCERIQYCGRCEMYLFRRSHTEVLVSMLVRE